MFPGSYVFAIHLQSDAVTSHWANDCRRTGDCEAVGGVNMTVCDYRRHAAKTMIKEGLSDKVSLLTHIIGSVICKSCVPVCIIREVSPFFLILIPVSYYDRASSSISRDPTHDDLHTGGRSKTKRFRVGQDVSECFGSTLG
jgi:hypothetical protein